MSTLKYLAGYSPKVLDQIHSLITNNTLAEFLTNKYPNIHQIRTDKALYTYTIDIKKSQLR